MKEFVIIVLVLTNIALYTISFHTHIAIETKEAALLTLFSGLLK